MITIPLRRAAACAAAAVLAGFGGQASAAVLVGAKTIQVSTDLEVLQLGEVQAFEDGTGVDVALSSEGASASANQLYDGTTPASNAIDGANVGGDYSGAYGGSPGIYHGVNTGALLTITLAAPKTLSGLAIWGRTDCCRERNVYKVQVFDASDALLYTGTVDTVNARNTGSIDFAATTGAPEPASWALMIAGFGLAGGALRRRVARVA